MIDFVRRSVRWFGTSEYTYCIGVAWLGGMPIPIFRVTMNDALQTGILLMLWCATAALTAYRMAVGPLPAPETVAHWIGALI